LAEDLCRDSAPTLCVRHGYLHRSMLPRTVAQTILARPSNEPDSPGRVIIAGAICLSSQSRRKSRSGTGARAKTGYGRAWFLSVGPK
jgi:hypothetical protein